MSIQANNVLAAEFIRNWIDKQIVDEVYKSIKMTTIFVFGANLKGIHGAGAAKHARDFYGARLGEIRRTGDAYGIPTKDENIRTLPLDRIAPYVQEFLAYAKSHPELSFVLTRIGCGLAGYTDADIAPMFAHAPANVLLPVGFERVIAKL